jgi:hypothetical protein
MLAERQLGQAPEFSVAEGLLVLVILLGIAYAAGYFTRDLKSRRRRAEARRASNYIQPDWLRPSVPANTNEARSPATGELGQMLDRWESRARSRRAG